MKYRLTSFGIENVERLNGQDEYPLDGRTFEGRTKPENKVEEMQIIVSEMLDQKGMFIINAKGEEMFMPIDMFEEVTE